MQTSLDSGFRLDAICVRYLNTCSLTLVPVMGSNVPDSSFVQPQTPGGVESTLIAFQLHHTVFGSKGGEGGKIRKEVDEVEVEGW